MRIPTSLSILLLVAGLTLSSLAADKPNIIFILADDMGYGDLGCFGQKTLATPNLDRMAAEGMKFTRHYAGSTVCAPSRCVLLTGLHTGHCSVRGNNAVNLKSEDVTIAEVLKKAGYATACTGKWGVGNPPPLNEPAEQGFDLFYGYINMYHAHNFYPEFLIRNGKKEKLRNVTKPDWKNKPGREDGGPKEGSGVAIVKKDYAPDLIANEAVKFIEQHKEGPFFLYFAMNVPHANNEGGSDKDQKDGMEVPDYGEYTSKDWPNPEKGFASMMRNIDRDVGRVLAKLKELGIDDNTLVIFSSDNGPHAEGRHEMEYFNSNGPLRGMKRDLYDGGVRVPTIARWPGKVKAGTETDLLSGFQDVLATCADLAGVAIDKTDGISFAPTLMGNSKEQNKHQHLYWEFLERGGKQGVVTKQWKAIRLNTTQDQNGPLELYNLNTDNGEENNVAAQHPALIKKFAEIMKAEHTHP